MAKRSLWVGNRLEEWVIVLRAARCGVERNSFLDVKGEGRTNDCPGEGIQTGRISGEHAMMRQMSSVFKIIEDSGSTYSMLLLRGKRYCCAGRLANGASIHKEQQTRATRNKGSECAN